MQNFTPISALGWERGPEGWNFPLCGRVDPQRRMLWPISIVVMGFYTNSYSALVFYICGDSLHRLRSYCWDIKSVTCCLDMLWICCTRFDFCGFAVQLLVQQIHNKSYKRSYELRAATVTLSQSRSTVGFWHPFSLSPYLSVLSCPFECNNICQIV